MELIPAFDPTLATSGSFVASTLQTGSQIIITNKSYVNMIFTFASGDQRPVLANDRRAFTFGGASSVPGPTIKWQQQSIDYPQTINQLENLVFVEIYAPTEIVTEKYPTIIQRETLPTLVPYNVGASIISTGLINPNTTNHTIWPSSYNGVTCAPQALGAVDGMGFDHYWAVFGPSFNLLDLPGNYPTTGKTTITTTINNSTLASFIPGPFSKAGLTPVDSAIHLNGTYWQLTNLITWTTNFYIDAWFNLDSVGGRQYFVIADNVISIGINASGTIFGMIQYSGGAAFATSSITAVAGQWFHVALYVVGTSIQLWVNGVQVASTGGSGTIVATSTHVKIGADNSATNTFIGSVANVGVLLSDIQSTQWGKNAIQARYELGLQSLNVDMQNVWLQGFDIYTYSGPTTWYTYSLSNIQNTAGLLYRNTQIINTPLHVKQPGNIFGDFIIPQQTTNYVASFRFPTPITNLPADFMNFNDWISTGPQYAANFYGYNMLGFS